MINTCSAILPGHPGAFGQRSNVERAKKMIRQGQMTGFGFNIFHEGTKAKKRVPSSKNFSVPDYFKEALAENKKAWNHFDNFAPSAKLAYVYWVNTAKTEETRQKRIKKSIQRLAKNKKFGEYKKRIGPGFGRNSARRVDLSQNQFGSFSKTHCCAGAARL